MKKLLLAVTGLFCSLYAAGQSRGDISQFSLFQQYYNPSLTGNYGSAIKSFYRNQWTGFEDAPKTIFVSGELSFADLKGRGMPGNRRRNGSGFNPGSSGALGLSVLHKSFGPYGETQAFLSYGSAIRLSEGLNLRWGTALVYESNSLDGSKLNVAGDDPKYQHLLGQNNRKSKVDLNLGIALTSSDFYVAYALQDVTKGGIISSGDAFLEDSYSRKHMVQAGYRTNLSDQFGIVVNSLLVLDKLQKKTIEGQVKGVYKNMLWAGAGYRNDLAYNLTAGVKWEQLLIGYAYEMPAGDGSDIPNNTNEIVLSYQFSSSFGNGRGNRITIW